MWQHLKLLLSADLHIQRLQSTLHDGRLQRPQQMCLATSRWPVQVVPAIRLAALLLQQLQHSAIVADYKIIQLRLEWSGKIQRLLCQLVGR